MEGNVGTETIQALIDRFSPSVKSSNPQRIKAKCFPNIYPPLGERSDRWKPPKLVSREIEGDEVDHMKVILHVIPVGDGNHCFEVEHRFNPLKTFPLTIAYLRQVFFCFVFKHNDSVRASFHHSKLKTVQMGKPAASIPSILRKCAANIQLIWYQKG